MDTSGSLHMECDCDGIWHLTLMKTWHKWIDIRIARQSYKMPKTILVICILHFTAHHIYFLFNVLICAIKIMSPDIHKYIP